MKMDEVYTVQPYRFTPEGEKYEKIGLSVKDATGESVARAISQAYVKKDEEVPGDIPAIKFVKRRDKWEVDKVAAAERDVYLDSVIERVVELFPAEFSKAIEGYNVTSADLATPSVSKPVEASVPQLEAEAVTSNIESDDLPF
jgi:hypothetical protein